MGEWPISRRSFQAKSLVGGRRGSPVKRIGIVSSLESSPGQGSKSEYGSRGSPRAKSVVPIESGGAEAGSTGERAAVRKTCIAGLVEGRV